MKRRMRLSVLIEVEAHSEAGLRWVANEAKKSVDVDFMLAGELGVGSVYTLKKGREVQELPRMMATATK